MSNKLTTLSHQGKFLASCAAGALLCTSQAYAVNIDNFNDLLEVIQTGVGVNSGTIVDGGTNMISASRMMTSTVTADPDNNGLTIRTDTGNLNFNLGSNASGSGLIEWSGFAATDLRANGEDSMAVEVIFDDAPVDLIFRIYSSASDWVEGTINLAGGNFGTATTHYLSFANFTVGSGSMTVGEIIGSATDIELEIANALPGTDLTINLMETADDPDEPTYATLAAGPTSTTSGDTVSLSWETSDESDHAGFNVWRCEQIESNVSGDNGLYSVTDDVMSGTIVHVLEDINNAGQSQFTIFE